MVQNEICQYKQLKSNIMLKKLYYSSYKKCFKPYNLIHQGRQSFRAITVREGEQLLIDFLTGGVSSLSLQTWRITLERAGDTFNKSE